VKRQSDRSGERNRDWVGLHRHETFSHNKEKRDEASADLVGEEGDNEKTLDQPHEKARTRKRKEYPSIRSFCGQIM
jgi:hypothetical protein